MSESAAESGTGDTGEAGDVQTDPSTETGDTGQEAQPSPEDLAKERDRWKGLAQRYEKTSRENSAAAKKLRDIEEASKTDLQKAQDRQAELERERDAALFSQSRMMAAAAHDLSPELIDFLGDGTAEEINARAETLAGIIKTSAEKLASNMGPGSQLVQPPASRRPVESMRPGAAPAGTGAGTPDQMFRSLLNGDNS
jgi:hypothetical protein